MTKRHTWSFNPVEFNASLVSAVVSGGSLHLDQLRRVCSEVAARVGVSGRVYLEMISLEDSDFLDDEWIHQDVLYAASMADRLVPAPGGSYVRNVIPALRFAQWSEVQVNSVLLGDHLATLVHASESDVLREGVESFLADYRYGGWLSADRASGLLVDLEKLADLFAKPPPELLEQYPPELAQHTVRGLLVEAYQEATLPLEAGIARKEAIRFVDRF